ncbi:CBS domain-containing protein [Glycocaulis profundi]|nr:CBS domain-containing protein [Glycocaulis profundi]
MKVSDMMTRDVRMTHPGDSIEQAARMMAEIDAGAVPVADGDRLVGMITDRDIAIRAVARGMGPDATVEQVMTRDVKYCYADEDSGDVCRNLGDIQLRRLPVVDRDKRLVGILSLGDLALNDGDGSAGAALTGISRHTGATTGATG